MPEAERTLLFRLLDRLDEMELRAEGDAHAGKDGVAVQG